MIPEKTLTTEPNCEKNVVSKWYMLDIGFQIEHNKVTAIPVTDHGGL
jgi:hypothetical protein